MKKLVLLFGLILLVCGAALAQQKWGHINSNELLNSMPELKKVQLQLEDYSKQLDTQNNSMLSEYQSKLTEWQQNGQNLETAIQETKVQELKDLEARITSFQGAAGGKISSKEIEMLKPVMSKIQDAIKTVSKEHGYTYILDTSSGAILYWPESSSDDIMPLVKQQLGI